MAKQRRIIPLVKPQAGAKQKPKLIAADEQGQRIVVGIGSQRLALDFFSRITRLPPRTGDEPAPVLPVQKRPGLRTSFALDNSGGPRDHWTTFEGVCVSERMGLQMFVVDRNNNIKRYDSKGAIALAPDLCIFGSERELAALAAKWPAARLAVIWNRLLGVSNVRKFTDRKTGVRRIWKAIQVAHAIPASTSSLPQGTKTERVIALLRASGGATLDALMALTGWQSHSVRGFLSAQLAKKRRLRIQSFKRNGERVYRIRP